MAAALDQILVSPQTSGLISAPVLVAQGEADSLVLASMQNNWVTKVCAAGQELDYRTYPGLGHMPLVAPDSPLTAELVTWTQDRLAGKPARSTC